MSASSLVPNLLIANIYLVYKLGDFQILRNISLLFIFKVMEYFLIYQYIVTQNLLLICTMCQMMCLGMDWLEIQLALTKFMVLIHVSPHVQFLRHLIIFHGIEFLGILGKKLVPTKDYLRGEE